MMVSWESVFGGNKRRMMKNEKEFAIGNRRALDVETPCKSNPDIGERKAIGYNDLRPIL